MPSVFIPSFVDSWLGQVGVGGPPLVFWSPLCLEVGIDAPTFLTWVTGCLMGGIILCGDSQARH